MRRLVVIAVSALSLSALIAIPAAPPAVASDVARIELHPAVIEVQPDTEVAYTVEAFDADDVSLGMVDAQIGIQYAPSTWWQPGSPTVSPAGFCPGAICQSTYAGDNTVTATVGDLEATATLRVQPGEPTGVFALGPFEGRAGEPVLVDAAVVDRWRNRTSTGPVSFLISAETGGGGSGAGASCTVGSGCSAEKVGAYRITAYYDLNETTTVSAVHRVTIRPNVPANLTMMASPQTVYGTLLDDPSSTIRITVTDAYGNPTPGARGVVTLTDNQTGRLGHGTPQPPDGAGFATPDDGTLSFRYQPGLLAGRDTYTATVDHLTAATTITYLPLPVSP